MKDILKTGEYGVPLFFAISGFILAIPFASHHLDGKPAPPLRKYLLRRLTRLEPPYLFCLFGLTAAYFVKDLFSGVGHVSIVETAKHTLASVFYLHRPIYGFEGMVTRIYWSLEIEVQFYLVASFICTVFALGPFVRRRIMIAVVSLLGVFGVVYVDLWPAMTTPWLIFIGYLAVFKGSLVRRFFAATPVVIVGGMCYSIYLWHLVTLSAYRFVHVRLFDPEHGVADRLLFVVIASCVAIPICTIFYVLIEHPTMDPKWPRKLAGFLRFRARKTS